MGLFDIFKGGSKSDATPGDKKAAAAAKWADRAGDKRAQNYDRQEAIAALAEMGTAESAAALLKRFTFTVDPSITDQEEREKAFNGVLKAGDQAIAPVRAFSAKAESLAWPIRIVKSLLSEELYVQELILWLQPWDTEYSKFIDPKLQILATLEDHVHPSIRPAVEPFLDDVNESARYHAAATLLAQNDPDTLSPLLKMLPKEESFRIKNKIADAIATKGWKASPELQQEVDDALPPSYMFDSEGRVVHR